MPPFLFTCPREGNAILGENPWQAESEFDSELESHGTTSAVVAGGEFLGPERGRKFWCLCCLCRSILGNAVTPRGCSQAV